MFMRVLASMIGVVLSLSVLAEGPKFKLVTENFPPFNLSVNNKNFEHDEADISGLCTEIVQEIFKNAGLEYKLKLRQWDYAYGYAQKKANRGVFCTTRTESRESLFKWVGPLASNDWVVFSLSNFSGNIKKESDLKKYKIGAYKGDVRAEYLLSKGMNVSELADDRLNPERLEEGMIDLWISSSFAGPKLAKESGVNI
jgi:polar amino acid transport system substrate-binding protein